MMFCVLVVVSREATRSQILNMGRASTFVKKRRNKIRIYFLGSIFPAKNPRATCLNVAFLGDDLETIRKGLVGGGAPRHNLSLNSDDSWLRWGI